HTRRPRVRHMARTFVTLAAAATVWGACKKSAPPPAPPAPEVAVVKVEPQRVPPSFGFPGEVQPYPRGEVRSGVDGIVEARPFTEGATVKPGQVLYRIDPVRPEAAFRSALARYEVAKRTLERIEPLVSQNAVAQQDVDNARAELDEAAGNLAEA